MTDQFSRTRLLLGEAGMQKLQRARVAVFGLGGVGSYAVEALARSGVGTLDLIDNDRISLTNLNRLLYATHENIGRLKTEVVSERIKAICPQTVVHTFTYFYTDETACNFDFKQYDYVADAIDTVAGKLSLAEQAHAANVPIISCMGAGNKLDGSQFRVADIYKTKMCPLAKVMRYELRRRGVKKLKVVYSEEQPIRPVEDMSISCRTHCICPPGAKHKCTERRDIPGSVAFVPSVAGLLIAGEVVKDLTTDERKEVK